MKFSLWMIRQALADYEPVVYIRGIEARNIENIRMYSEQEERRNRFLYIEKSSHIFHDDREKVVCLHGKNYMILEETDMNLIFNRILTFLEEKQARTTRLSAMVSGNCMLKDVLTEFSDVLPMPIMVLDASQVVLAHSGNYGIGSVDEPWDKMLATGTFGVDIIEEYNRLYRHLIPSKTPYLVPANPFPFQSYNRNIYIENEFMGFVTLILQGKTLDNAEKDWFDVACQYVINWFFLYARQNEILMMQTAFQDMLNGRTADPERFQGALNTLGWQTGASMRLLLLDCISDHLNMNQHVAKILNRRANLFFAAEYENCIAVLVNESAASLDTVRSIAQPLLKNSGYYGGISNSFSSLSELSGFLIQARTAMEYSPSEPGMLYPCEDYILPFLLLTVRNNTRLEIRHPAVLALRDYDRAHGSDYARLLYTYLTHLCSQSGTAELLHLHRSTLIRRIHWMEQKYSLDLDDYQTRLLLLLSFEYEKILH